jgi:hypothetical protein
MIERQYKCDSGACTQIKGETNHWIIAVLGKDGCWFLPWSAQEANEDGALHICGAACAHKVLDKYLESLRKESENVQSV